MIVEGILLMLGLAAGDPPNPAAVRTNPAALTHLWRDAPGDKSLVRIDPIPEIPEPSDLLFRGKSLYTVSDSYPGIFELDFGEPAGALRKAGTWEPKRLPPATDLEALALLRSGEVLVANETQGVIFVLSPFPEMACAAWQTGVTGECFIGRANCGIEAMTVLPGGRLLVVKERDPRAAYLFDVPDEPCRGGTLENRRYLKLPDVGPDVSAATFDEETGRLLLVARSRQEVIEVEINPLGGDGALSLDPVGTFKFAKTEDSLEYSGVAFHQVEGIAVDEDRVLHLVVDNNLRLSRAFGDRSAALLRFFPAD